LSVNIFGRFVDSDMEARFYASERRASTPFIRAYAGIIAIGLLCYAITVPLFFDKASALQFVLLILTSLALLGGYAALTFWRGYLAQPLTDFVCLLALAVLISADNILLLHNLMALGVPANAPMQLSSFIVTAFAAIAFAGRPRWFLPWMGFHSAFLMGLLWLSSIHADQLVFVLLSHGANLAVALLINWMLGRQHRATFAISEALEMERSRNETLLYNVLPQGAAERLKAGLVVADSYSDASVVFIDVVGFSTLAKRVSPGHLLEVLNGFFSLADHCAAEHGVEKVKTIGDAYLAIAGGTVASPNSANSAIAFADAVLAGLEDVRTNTGISISIRIGIHSGPVVGGVIGATRIAYDYWGETLNVAARIESTAGPNCIAVSESTYLRCHARYRFGPPQTMVLKGLGEMTVYHTDGVVTEERLSA
jgi:class 3 adenylate cyclase